MCVDALLMPVNCNHHHLLNKWLTAGHFAFLIVLALYWTSSKCVVSKCRDCQLPYVSSYIYEASLTPTIFHTVI